MNTTTATSSLPTPLVVAIDVVLVAVFCTIGRLSHAEGIFSDIPGLLNTMWPFLVAVLLANGVAILVRLRADRLPTGWVVWAITVVAGLLLRVASAQGTALPFVIVAAVTLALFLVGWRGIVAVVRQVQARAAS